jgi:hypothetical protein
MNVAPSRTRPAILVSVTAAPDENHAPSERADLGVDTDQDVVYFFHDPTLVPGTDKAGRGGWRDYGETAGGSSKVSPHDASASTNPEVVTRARGLSQTASSASVAASNSPDTTVAK